MRNMSVSKAMAMLNQPEEMVDVVRNGERLRVITTHDIAIYYLQAKGYRVRSHSLM